MQVLRALFTGIMAGVVPLCSFAQDDDIAPVTGTYAVTNVKIIQAPGQAIEKGTVVFRDGVIISVGPSVSIPVDAKVIKADSMFVYAGFIDGMSHVGVEKPKEQEGGRRRPDVDDPGNPPNAIAGIQPEQRVRSFLNPEDNSLDDWRKAGFTAAHVVPNGRMLPGTGSVILLSGESPDAMIYKSEISLFSQLDGGPRVYPNTVMGVMAKYRELYRQAEQAKKYEGNYKENPSGMARPTSNSVLESFYPVIDKSLPVAFKAEEVLDIQRVITLKKDLGFNLVLGEVKQGWDIIDDIKRNSSAVFLSLDLPEWEEEKEKSDSTKTEEKEKSDADLEKERLEKRKEEMLTKFYQQPVLFNNDGVTYGFSTLEAKGKDLKSNLSKLVQKGLSEDAALAALTTNPAKLLGLSASMGTVETGKLANLIVTDKPYFDEKSIVKYVFVDGHMYEYEGKPKKKKSDGKDVDPTGTWGYTTETPQGSGSGTITIEGESGSYTGEISSNFSAEVGELSDVSVSGNELTFSFVFSAGGSEMTIDVLVTIDGDTFEGTMTVGQYGSFPMEGERTPEN